MDDRVVDFNELKNKVRDKDINNFESYIYSLYYSLAEGKLSIGEFTKNITNYMEENNVSQEKFFNLQREMLKRYGVDFSDIGKQMEGLGIKVPPMNLDSDYEKIRKSLSFQDKYKEKISNKNVILYSIKNNLNSLEIVLEQENIILKSCGKINLQDVELNEFLCSYKKTIDNKQLSIHICENVHIYEY